MSKLTTKQIAPFLILVAIAVAAVFVPSVSLFNDEGKLYSPADTAWIIVATALVFLMNPGYDCYQGRMCDSNSSIVTVIHFCFVRAG